MDKDGNGVDLERIYQNQTHAQIHQPHFAPPVKVSMGMVVAPNPNPADIQISMDIHVFRHYVREHKIF
jgi:hypothetical protein